MVSVSIGSFLSEYHVIIIVIWTVNFLDSRIRSGIVQYSHCFSKPFFDCIVTAIREQYVNKRDLFEIVVLSIPFVRTSFLISHLVVLRTWGRGMCCTFYSNKLIFYFIAFISYAHTQSGMFIVIFMLF